MDMHELAIHQSAATNCIHVCVCVYCQLIGREMTHAYVCVCCEQLIGEKVAHAYAYACVCVLAADW